jgi:hypothetical protein
MRLHESPHDPSALFAHDIRAAARNEIGKRNDVPCDIGDEESNDVPCDIGDQESIACNTLSFAAPSGHAARLP